MTTDLQTHFYATDCSHMSADEKTAYKKQLRGEHCCPVHETRDGRIIPVKFMRDTHLQNSVHHFIRKVWTLYSQSCQTTSMVQITSLLIEAQKIRDYVRVMTSELGRRGYEPTDRDLKALSGMLRTIDSWMPDPRDLAEERGEL